MHARWSSHPTEVHCADDHERKTLREVERQFQAEDPESTRSFDTRAQRLRRRPAESGRAALITPIVDRLRKVDMQIITQPVPAQDGTTRDNVTVRVDACSTTGSSTRYGWPWTCRTRARPSCRSRVGACTSTASRSRTWHYPSR